MDSDRRQAVADRLAAKLDSMALDQEEQELLCAFLIGGAGSVEMAGIEVEGFALQPYLSLKAQKQGKLKAFDEAPKETITFAYGGLVISYVHQ